MLMLALIGVLPPMAELVGLASFITYLYAIAGVQLFSGSFRQICVNDETAEILESRFMCRQSIGVLIYFNVQQVTLVCAKQKIQI